MQTSNPSTNRSLAQVLTATLVAFVLLLALAPGADAQTRTRGGDEIGKLGCPDGWVPSSAPGGCQPGRLTLKVATLDFDFDNGCPDRWVPSSAPGGCSPGFFTLKTAGLKFDNGCPDRWVPSSAPGGCSPGFFTLDTGGRVFEAQHHCAFGSDCDAMVEAVIALGGHCTSSSLGETCELPTGPPDGRD